MIYADNAATTKISEVALEKMLPFLHEQYGNASSQYSLGIIAKRAIENSRNQVASAIRADANEIIFTSGGSEANSWVLKGITELFSSETMHIVTSSIEHNSIIKTCHNLKNKNVEISYLPVNSRGQVSIDDVKASIKPNTKLVSIMLANNEIGSIQPLAEIGSFLHDRGILFHSDAVQAVGHIPINVDDLNVDFLSASAHKFNGPKGVGFLYRRANLNLPSMIFGGEQERGFRAGTENIAGIVALGYALEENIADMLTVTKKLDIMINNTVRGIQEMIPSVRINGDEKARLPGIINLGFKDVSGEAIMNILDLKGICISTSSACNTGKNTPSHVLLALGLSEVEAKSTIRISYGKYNTLEEVEDVVCSINDAYVKLKKAR